MKASHHWSLLQKKLDVTRPATITWSNIKGVIQSIFRKKRMQISGFELDDHIYEQIIWRRSEVQQLSPKCWSQGYCKVCGCDTLGKTMEDRSCEGACYPEMMNKDQWKNYKKIQKIKLFN